MYKYIWHVEHIWSFVYSYSFPMCHIYHQFLHFERLINVHWKSWKSISGKYYRVFNTWIMNIAIRNIKILKVIIMTLQFSNFQKIFFGGKIFEFFFSFNFFRTLNLCGFRILEKLNEKKTLERKLLKRELKYYELWSFHIPSWVSSRLFACINNNMANKILIILFVLSCTLSLYKLSF